MIEGAIGATHRAGEKWALLYRILWRLAHGERTLLDDPLDADVSRLNAMVQQVRTDVHRMKAFVRFTPVRPVSAR